MKDLTENISKAWNGWHKGVDPDEIPSPSLAFERGYELGYNQPSNTDALVCAVKFLKEISDGSKDEITSSMARRAIKNVLRIAANKNL